MTIADVSGMVDGPIDSIATPVMVRWTRACELIIDSWEFCEQDSKQR